MITRASIAALLQELSGDMAVVEKMATRNAQAWTRIQQGARDPLDWGALGYTLHGLYGAIENYCLRISKFFENSLPPDHWHTALLEKMKLNIRGLRPALFTEEADYRRAMELMKFRHRFRNLYGEDLDPDKTAEVQQNAIAMIANFRAIHQSFVAKIDAIGEELP